ncbi:alpha/beta fold hydrolase [Streptomyces europaeiscabiei]|uniref:alpha/beta fold hydrolase n=1 Tax=Streptomyces europaeiscabiei TaxID=146819 RepID=UPI000766053A|nr:alpha/beta hydrolase [Streptomyces europaeiscabiei]MDX2757140.1 alpha/beta hydrolase [Streptomyces europaeiscabiei]MDX2766808.1 alpha/beta hydrolase [Streptomyces europaeiscabiei]MDX3584697.1 alpha/beta hydrolase [Streptomyces europaeiscabiei]MDX3843625.1 alpha/beta hydrolase [Streptomyces europaeiscabiei]
MPSLYRGAECQQRVRNWCLEQLDEWHLPHQRHEIPTTAGVTSVITVGPEPAPAAPTLVLVPGTNTNGSTYRHISEALAAHWPTVVLDVPGQPGLSADVRPRRGRSLWYGRWLIETLEQVVPGPAVVVGHSLGGAIVLAADSPRIVGRVLLSSAGLVRLLVPPAVVAATVPWLVRPSVPRAARVLRRMVAPGGRVPDELAEWMALVARCCHSSLAPPPLPPRLLAARRSVPCLVATGRHDVFLPPHRVAPAAQRHLGTTLHVLDDSGHLLLDEAPDKIVALVESVLARCAGEGT